MLKIHQTVIEEYTQGKRYFQASQASQSSQELETHRAESFESSQLLNESIVMDDHNSGDNVASEIDSELGLLNIKKKNISM